MWSFVETALFPWLEHVEIYRYCSLETPHCSDFTDRPKPQDFVQLYHWMALMVHFLHKAFLFDLCPIAVFASWQWKQILVLEPSGCTLNK